MMFITKRKYPWIGEQTWQDILFLHWKTNKDCIRPYVPEVFEIDTYKGDAWVSIVLFQAKNSLFRGMPKQFSYFPLTQINVRTYVNYPRDEERGVYFFQLRVNSLLAALGARLFYGLPFYNVANQFKKEENKIQIRSSSEHSNLFSVQYKSNKKVLQNDFTNFLTERYCIWNIFRNRVAKIPIRHKHWVLNEADVLLQENKLFSELMQKKMSSTFVAQYSRFQQALLYPFEIWGKA